MTSLPQRKSPRLQGYDYSANGAYFVTICAHQRLHLFGNVEGEMLSRSYAGDAAFDCWQTIPDHYRHVTLDAFVVMPNHVHGILFLQGDTRKFKTILGRVINAYKGAVTARIRRSENTEVIIWQGRYHDHIIRSESELNVLRLYIANNLAKWSEDTLYEQQL